jgi:hypothetical protein
MKRLSLVLILPLLLTGCANNAEKVESGSTATIYFVSDTPRGFKLFSEKREFPKSEDLSKQIISDLVSGKIAPKDPNYVNLWGSTNSVNSITTENSIATIDLGNISLNVGSESEQRAIDQIVWTYLEFNTSIKSVRFTANGKTIESFAGHVDTTKEFMRAPDYEVLNPLQISSINEGDELSNPIKISGEACTFEANVFWRLSKDGKVLKEGSTTAGMACPERSAWSVTLDKLNPGSYKFETIEFSAEDGSLFAIDDKNFKVK